MQKYKIRAVLDIFSGMMANAIYPVAGLFVPKMPYVFKEDVPDAVHDTIWGKICGVIEDIRKNSSSCRIINEYLDP